MVSINTNLSSLLVQNNLTQSTNGLNKAIERLTTGYKINHASDNAAGYSIAQNMTSQLSSYDIASDNISMGLDLLSVAQNTISQMQDRGQRLMSLWTQAQNGTYGATSISAINQEATAIMQEINRLYINAEYNGINLFGRKIEVEEGLARKSANKFIGETEVTENSIMSSAGLSQEIDPANNGFIANAVTHTQEEVNALTHVADVDEFEADTEYQVSTKEDLLRLAELTNSGANTEGVTFVMGADIDLSSVENWTSIGFYEYNENFNPMSEGGWEFIDCRFNGVFDGNGHTISNLKINNTEADYQGLFGQCNYSAEIKNVSVKNANVRGHNNVGIVAGNCTLVNNCYTTGTVSGNNNVASVVGDSNSMSNCYSSASVNGNTNVGGISGTCYCIENCYFTGSVTGTSNVGGITGTGGETISNCYTAANISGNNYVGGIVGNGHFVIEGWYGEPGMGFETEISYCYSTSTIAYTGENGERIGGIAGIAGNITDSYSTTSINAGDADCVGGIAGDISSCVNCFSTGNISGNDYVGGLFGWTAGGGSALNSYSTGNITGNNYVGGLAGLAETVQNSYSTGDVLGNTNVGGLAGELSCYGGMFDSYYEGDVNGVENVGGLFGCGSDDIYVNNCYSDGLVSGTNCVGGIAGIVKCGTIENSYTTSIVNGNENVGGIIGKVYSESEWSSELNLNNVISYADISGNNSTGGFIGEYGYEYYNEDYDETVNYTLNISGSKCAKSAFRAIGAYSSSTESDGEYSSEYNDSYDASSILDNVTDINVDFGGRGSLQVGINGDASSTIEYNTSLRLNLSISDISSVSAYDKINKFLSTLSDKATEFGAISNRLESALESTIVAMENLTSSLSTIKDADIAQVSSEYIKKQILQQASATLLATANQAPSIALQLL